MLRSRFAGHPAPVHTTPPDYIALCARPVRPLFGTISQPEGNPAARLRPGHKARPISTEPLPLPVLPLSDTILPPPPDREAHRAHSRTKFQGYTARADRSRLS